MDKFTFKFLSVLNAFLFSAKGLLSLAFIEILAFLLPLQGFFFSVVALVVLDTFSALWAVKKESRSWIDFYSRLQSKKFFRIVEKVVFYCLMGIGLYIVGFGIGEGELMKKCALGVVGFIEIKSNIENIEKITGKDIWSLLESFINKTFLSPKN